MDELTGSMVAISHGQLDTAIGSLGLTNEIGDMARALSVLAEGLRGLEQLRREQEEMDHANMRLMSDVQEALRVHAEELDYQVIEKTQNLAEREREIIWRLSRATERRDTDTGDHIARMSRICGIIAAGLGMPAADCYAIELASQMHDIGKVGIPDAILFKQGRLPTKNGPSWKPTPPLAGRC